MGPSNQASCQGHGFSLLFFTPNKFPSPRVRHLSSEWTQESRDHRHWGPRPWKPDHAQPGNFRTSATVPLSALNHRTSALGPKMVMFIFLLLSQATARSLERFHFYVQSIWPLRVAQAEGWRAALPCPPSVVQSLIVGLRLVSLRSTSDSWTSHWDVKKRNYQYQRDFSKIALQHWDLLQLWLKHSDAWWAPREGWEGSRSVSPSHCREGQLCALPTGPSLPRNSLCYNQACISWLMCWWSREMTHTSKWLQ